MKYSSPIFLLIAALVATFAIPSPAWAQGTREGLISFWEQTIRNDPDTVRFDKISDSEYQFKTRRFDFDGNVKLIDAAIMDGHRNELAGASKFGTVQFELENVPEELKKKISYATFLSKFTNFYYIIESKKWLTEFEYMDLTAKMMEKRQKGSPGIAQPIDILVVIGVIVILALYWKNNQVIKNTRKIQKDAMDRQASAMELDREAHQILKEIRDILKSMADRKQK